MGNTFYLIAIYLLMLAYLCKILGQLFVALERQNASVTFTLTTIILLIVVTKLSNMLNSSSSLSTKTKSVFRWRMHYRFPLSSNCDTSYRQTERDRPIQRTSRMAAVLLRRPGHSFYPLLSHWVHAAANHVLISLWHQFESRFPRFSS
jgi:hypothetical protein